MPRAKPAGTASVVTQLLAFLREPARHRTRYTSGRESLCDGHEALRFAQGKFPPDLAHDASSDARSELREAALAFIREVCLWEGATHYQALCVRPDAAREGIKENYHLLMALMHPDRRDAAAARWPKDCAQRVNLAYDVLGDGAKRREYDAELARAASNADATRSFSASATRTARPARAMRWPARVARAGVVAGAVIGTLFVFVMWQGDLSRETALVREWAGARSRDLVAAAERPRFLAPAADPVPANDPPAENPPAEPAILTPQLRKLAIRPAAEITAPTVRQEKIVVATSVEPQPAQAEEPAPAPAAAAPVVRSAQHVVQSQAQPRAPSPASRLSPEEIELLVVRLVDYYEAGDADKLMALLDAKDRSFADNARLHTLYADFFHATRQRTLRVNSIDWQSAENTAHARGEALLQAEYFGAATLERKVSLEMDVVLREGQLKIARLSLFPGAP